MARLVSWMTSRPFCKLSDEEAHGQSSDSLGAQTARDNLSNTTIAVRAPGVEHNLPGKLGAPEGCDGAADDSTCTPRTMERKRFNGTSVLGKLGPNDDDSFGCTEACVTAYVVGAVTFVMLLYIVRSLLFGSANTAYPFLRSELTSQPPSSTSIDIWQSSDTAFSPNKWDGTVCEAIRPFTILFFSLLKSSVTCGLCVTAPQGEIKGCRECLSTTCVITAAAWDFLTFYFSWMRFFRYMNVDHGCLDSITGGSSLSSIACFALFWPSYATIELSSAFGALMGTGGKKSKKIEAMFRFGFRTLLFFTGLLPQLLICMVLALPYWPWFLPVWTILCIFACCLCIKISNVLRGRHDTAGDWISEHMWNDFDAHGETMLFAFAGMLVLACGFLTFWAAVSEDPDATYWTGAQYFFATSPWEFFTAQATAMASTGIDWIGLLLL